MEASRKAHGGRRTLENLAWTSAAGAAIASAEMHRLLLHAGSALAGLRRDQAEDALHDFILRRAPNLVDRYRSELGTPESWFRRCFVDYCRKRVRQLRKQEERTRPLEWDESGAIAAVPVADPRPDPEQALESRDGQSVLLDAVAALPAKYSEVIVLSAEGFSDPEIAGRLGISVPNVKVRRHRGRQALRSALAAPDSKTFSLPRKGPR